MTQATSWYFAYGSDMNRAQMASRMGQALEAHVAHLPNYELVFNRKVRGGTATANVRPASGQTVYGVLYKISEAALRNLDRFEGAPAHYRRIQVTVTLGNRPVIAQVYIATKVEKGLRPAGHHLQTIVQGATEHALPAEYIEQIKAAAGG